MTTEEAIKYAENKIFKIRKNLDRPDSMYGSFAMISSELEFCTNALAALRAQQVAKTMAWERADAMTLEGAIETVKYAAAFNAENSPLTRALGVLVSAANAHQDSKVVEINNPLTLEDLRQMDGEPVYLVSEKFGIHRWQICYGWYFNDIKFDRDYYITQDFFASGTIKAYRNKPNED